MDITIYSTQGDGKAWPKGTYYNAEGQHHGGPGGAREHVGVFKIDSWDEPTGFAVIDGKPWALPTLVSKVAA